MSCVNITYWTILLNKHCMSLIIARSDPDSFSQLHFFSVPFSRWSNLVSDRSESAARIYEELFQVTWTTLVISIRTALSRMRGICKESFTFLVYFGIHGGQ